ncbi:MAG: hemolysin family protein [Verrucomicrobiia bacterium]
MSISEIIEIIIKFAIIAGLVFMNGFFVAAEFALVKVRDTQLEVLIARGNRRAKVAKKVIQNLSASLSACQVGITIASLALGWVGEPVFKVLLKPVYSLLSITQPETQQTIAVIVGFTGISYLHIIAGEQSAKWIGIVKPLQTSLWVSIPLRIFYFVMYPFNWLLNKSTIKLLNLIGIEQTDSHERSFSREELRLLFVTSIQKSERSRLEHEIILNAIDFPNRIVRDVMTPRKEIVFFSTDMDIDRCIEIAETTRYSRYPLCEDGDIDRTIGVVHIKDLYPLRKSAVTGKELISHTKKLIYVPPTARLQKILQMLLEKRLHVAIVVDEFGGTLGLVTLEDAIEELVGQIQDEFDEEKQPVVRVSENCWEIIGTAPLYELSEIVNQPINAEGISTISGWVTQHLGGFPKPGDVIQLGDFKLTILSVAKGLVTRVKLQKEKQDQNNRDIQVK